MSGLIQFPMIMGGVVPVVNLSGIKPGQLSLSPELLAGIFLGKIKSMERSGYRQGKPGHFTASQDHYSRPPGGWFGNDVDIHKLPRQGFQGLAQQDRLRQVH